MHPWDRLHRPITGQRLAEPRALETGLWARDRELRQPMSSVGEKQFVPDRKTRNNTHVAEARPNAPLLKRIVRHPYPLDPQGRARQVFREAVPWGVLKRDPLQRVKQVLAESYIKAGLPNPIQALAGDRRIERDGIRRPGAGAQDWLDSHDPKREEP
jgi:hypothetical protein